AFDGWSMGIFIRELTQLYEAYASDRWASLPALPIRYADYAVWQRQQLQGERLERLRHYWRSQLSDLPRIELPIRGQRPAVQTFRAGVCLRDIPIELSDKLTQLSRAHRTTPFVVLLTVFSILLKQYSGLDRIAVGT